ncbi:MAG: hypothetical protein NTZ16_14140 [Verrucomicrobia bacterium]|nr:hypothetical protein [Verrucomicrobiota bacterium]
MRTQKILVAAATLAVGIATSMADPVYSQNIVGYINLTLQPGFNLVANQLNSGAGSNALNAVFPTATDGAYIYTYGNGAFTIDIFDSTVPGWVDSTTGNPSATVVNPGQGFFYFQPGSATTVTLVGSVKTGTNSITLNPNFSLVSSATPESYSLTGTNFPVADGLIYYELATGGTGFNQSIYDATVPGWVDYTTGNPTSPTPSVGQGFFIFNPSSSITWTRAFNP